jgi:hypothetical protein
MNRKQEYFFVIVLISYFALNTILAPESFSEDIRNKTVYITKSEMKRVVWREDVYDQSLKANVSVIMIDEAYFSSVTDPEKAVLGYLASTIGNECFEDGGKQNVKCKLLTALNMGYQCSDANKTFLKNWFRDDAAIMKQIDKCKPLIAKTIEKTFDEVKISSADNIIKISLKGLKLNIKENSASKWSEQMTFKLDGDKLTLTDRTKKE